MAESYFQHAEHYFRILNAMNQAAQQSQGGGQGGAPGGAQGGQGHPGQRRQPGESQPDGEDEAEAQAAGLGEQPPDLRELPVAASGAEA